MEKGLGLVENTENVKKKKNCVLYLNCFPGVYYIVLTYIYHYYGNRNKLIQGLKEISL